MFPPVRLPWAALRASRQGLQRFGPLTKPLAANSFLFLCAEYELSAAVYAQYVFVLVRHGFSGIFLGKTILLTDGYGIGTLAGLNYRDATAHFHSA